MRRRLPVITNPSLDAKYLANEETVFMTGVQALVRLPLDQRRADIERGLRSSVFISGYQGSPLGTYDLELIRRAKLLAENDIVFQPGLNEELAATAVWGTQLLETVGGSRVDGVVGLWYGKTPGLDRASDALRHGNVIGTMRAGGAVALVGDDPTAKSSTLPASSEPALAGLEMPIVFPGDVQEVLDLGLHAISMSRSSGLWAAMKIVTNVADGSGTVRVGHDRVDPIMTQPEEDGRPYHHVPHSMLIGEPLQKLEQTLRYSRIEAAKRYVALNGLNRISVAGDRDELGIVAPGKTYFDLRDALARLGFDDDSLINVGVRILKVSVPFPLDSTLVRGFAAGLREILVVEEKRSFIETFVKDALYSELSRPLVLGKEDELGVPLFPANGELSSNEIARLVAQRLLRLERTDRAVLEERLAGLAPPPRARALEISRTPYFCSGCPHNTSTKVPDGSVVGAGIGCSGLVMLMDRKQVGNVAGVTQMGGEGAQWIGLAPFTETPHFIQNVGDGTFMHSGSLALRAAVASGVDMTYKILYNSAVAMTGGQTVQGEPTVEQLAQMALVEGVKRVIVTTDDVKRHRQLPRGVEVWDRSRSIEAQELLRTIPGITVLIHEQECAAERRRKRKRGLAPDPKQRIYINERVCEGCGDCGHKSNCLSVQPIHTEFGRKTTIDQSSCNKDYSCVEGDCPSFISVTPSGRTRRRARMRLLHAEDIPSPRPRTEELEFALRITGIGGTGIVTLAQVLAVAAAFDGWHVRGLDQTGMAQKGGPVVSDLRLSTSVKERSNKLAAKDSDLYLACDVLVAAEPTNLATLNPARTVAVVNEAAVPTGDMVFNGRLTLPPVDALLGRIGDRVRPDGLYAIDARMISERLFGSSQSSNIVLMGAAVQTGALPISPEAIEQAIQLNDVAVEANIQAFRWGRQTVADPEALGAVVGRVSESSPRRASVNSLAASIVDSVGATTESELRRLLDIRVPELIAYQNTRYARRYADTVARVRVAETANVSDGHSELAEAVARNLFKLMAYKDEAEVARLHLDPRLREDLESQFGGGARLQWQLHPPILRALGLRRKIKVGSWFTPVFHVLYAARHLRGHRLNPFGFGEVRRTERELIGEYTTLLNEVLTGLTSANHTTAVEIAELPDLIRGYEDVKLRSVQEYRERVAELRAQLAAQR